MSDFLYQESVHCRRDSTSTEDANLYECSAAVPVLQKAHTDRADIIIVNVAYRLLNSWDVTLCLADVSTDLVFASSGSS